MTKKPNVRILAAATLSYIVAGIAPAQTLPRAQDGRPDLQGIWMAVNRAAYNLEDHLARHDMPAGRSVVDGGEIPYQPWAAERRRVNFENLATADPLANCFLPGVPRVMALEFPFHIFQTDAHVAITFEWQQVYRLIYIDNEPPLYAGVEAWMGNSRGRWEDDVLVVEVTDQNDRTWYPAPIPADNDPFDAGAGANLSLPTVPPDIPRRADGKPDISGYFLADAGGANYGLEQHERDFLMPPSRGQVIDPADGRLPYQSWARAERIDRVLPHRGYDDPTAHCFVAGVPRSHYVPAPFYVLQPEGYIVVLHERMSWRHIFLDGRDFLPDHMRLWQGHSVGRWDGDTLVVESRNFNGKSWLNEAGDVVSHAQTVVETFTPVGPDQVTYRATVTDPIAYTRPWTIEMPFDRSGDELLEVACLEDNGDLQHLKDVRDAYRADQSQGDRP